MRQILHHLGQHRVFVHPAQARQQHVVVVVFMDQLPIDARDPPRIELLLPGTKPRHAHGRVQQRQDSGGGSFGGRGLLRQKLRQVPEARVVKKQVDRNIDLQVLQHARAQFYRHQRIEAQLGERLLRIYGVHRLAQHRGQLLAQITPRCTRRSAGEAASSASRGETPADRFATPGRWPLPGVANPPAAWPLLACVPLVLSSQKRCHCQGTRAGVRRAAVPGVQ